MTIADKTTTSEKTVDTKSKSPRRRLVAALAGVSATAFLAGCAKNAPQDVFVPKGENAHKI